MCQQAYLRVRGARGVCAAGPGGAARMPARAARWRRASAPAHVESTHNIFILGPECPLPDPRGLIPHRSQRLVFLP